MILYWRFFNFLVRRAVASAFVVIGGIVAAVNTPALLLGGTIPVNGVPTNDLVFRLASVGIPLLAAFLGVALYRAKPFFPQGFDNE